MRQRRSWIDIPSTHLSLSVLFVFLLIPLFQSVLDTGDAQALIYWQNNRNGTANGFDWQNGGSDKGLFGEPTLVGGNVFQFSPTNFRAESIDGCSAITSDRLQFDLIADPGKEIKNIKITESGDYGILFEGKVSASGAIFVTNLSLYEVRKQLFDMDPDMPLTEPTFSGAEFWSGQVEMTDINWSHIRVVLNNNLVAISMPGSITWIQKKDFGSGIDIEIMVVPEPATLCLFGLGALSLIRRKNNKKTQIAKGEIE